MDWNGNSYRDIPQIALVLCSACFQPKYCINLKKLRESTSYSVSLRNIFYIPSSFCKAYLHCAAWCVWCLHIHRQPFPVGKPIICWHIINTGSFHVIMCRLWQCFALQTVQLHVVYSPSANPPHHFALCFTSTFSQQSKIPVSACIFSPCLWDSSSSDLSGACLCVCVRERGVGHPLGNFLFHNL